jgi:hypothetical protein
MFLYFDRAIQELEKRVEQHFALQETAVKEDRRTNDTRMSLLNELRGNVVSREEYAASHEALIAKLEDLKEVTVSSSGMAKGRSGLLDNFGTVLFGLTVGGSSIAAIIISLVHH